MVACRAHHIRTQAGIPKPPPKPKRKRKRKGAEVGHPRAMCRPGPSGSAHFCRQHACSGAADSTVA